MNDLYSFCQLMCQRLQPAVDVVREPRGEINRQALDLGRRLTALGAEGHQVLLLYPAGLRLLCAYLACLYAKAHPLPLIVTEPAGGPAAGGPAAGGPAAGDSPPYWLQVVLNATADDSPPWAVLTSNEIFTMAEEAARSIPTTRSSLWLATDGVLQINESRQAHVH